MIMNMMRYMLGKLKVQRGATAVEYALMVALIAAVIVGTVGLLGTTVDGIFDGIVEKLAPAE